MGSQNYVACTKAGSGKVSGWLVAIVGGWLYCNLLEVVNDAGFRERVGKIVKRRGVGRRSLCS